MAKPPPAGPSSDISGVDRDWRVGLPSDEPEPSAAGEIDQAKQDGTARPEETKPAK